MNKTHLSLLPKLQQFIQSIGEENSSADIQSLQNTIDIKIQQTSITLNEIIHFYEYCESQEFLKMHSSRNWTDEEWKVLIWIIQQYCVANQKNSEDFKAEDWHEISEIIAIKDEFNCQFKWFSHLRVVPASKNWTSEEDQLLYKIMTKEPNIKWFEVQYEMFIQSSGLYFRKAKQYRERWNNYLNPQVNRGIWTELDDFNLLQIALAEGLRWSNISKKLKNRTENQVKNRFKSLINKEKKITQIPQGVTAEQSQDPSKNGMDKTTQFLIHSILNRLKPVQKLQQTKQNQQDNTYSQEQPYQQINPYNLLMNPQQYYFQQFQQVPQMPQLQPLSQVQQVTQFSTIPQIPAQINPLQQQMHCQTQQYPPQQPNISIQIPQHQNLVSQQLLQQQLIQQQQQQQQTMIPNFYQGQYFPQQFIQQQQQQQQFKFNVYSSQQNTPTNSIGTLSSQRSEKMISDQIKEEENSNSSSNKEPKVQKIVCVSAQSSINGSTSSVNSIDVIKQNFKNMNLDSDQVSPEIQKRKHQRSQSGAFDINNQAKMKTKRSRFYYASNDG
ncbi:unnamed protein product (macronuclear) [Paramecium tetraurelia]|uniref:Uncharacterized protein n=1 Tax=Paramecium tetraurelia TaxID=5888 RepID=A0EFU2_PARTE|nr:uncharacterized protein GSPATT00026506001 [Paramecium tetraurelia]CAK94183.1 unnamed protein product [Paramecium tetraurelia]|eukprot:XP_001461556.1 hypothetical protein (macronuclear) [Paramecium tetraurelia strain d4-2]